MENYRIKKNHHRCNRWWPKLHDGILDLEFTVEFDPNCTYDLHNDNNYDINKLYGISWGLHHQDSFRIGWNVIDKQLYLHAYYYNNGVEKNEPLDIIPFGVPLDLKIEFHRNLDAIFIRWNDKTQFVDYEFPKIDYGYYLFPYFGGDEVSPNNMNIKIIER